jgi:integrase/recombinase XerD
MSSKNEKSNTVFDSDLQQLQRSSSAVAVVPYSLTAAPEAVQVSMRRQVTRAVEAWLLRSNSKATRVNYAMDLDQFLEFIEAPIDALEHLLAIRPATVAAWRDHLRDNCLTNSSIRRKLTALRSLFSYLRTYGYLGANPAHSDFVDAPSAPRDGKTVGLAPSDCRRLLDAPDLTTPIGLRDRALLAVLAYSACRVGELLKLRLGDFKSHSGHRVLEVQGKGGKERRVALHPEAVERLEAWIELSGNIACDGAATPLFRPPRSARGKGRDGFKTTTLSTRSVEYLVERYIRKLGLDPAVTVHSLRVTALTTARERGSDVIDLQDFAGHADPRTTLTYIRNRDRLAKSPAYTLKY